MTSGILLTSLLCLASLIQAKQITDSDPLLNADFHTNLAAKHSGTNYMHLMSEQEDISEARGGEAISNAFSHVADKLINVLPEEKELINYMKERDSIVARAQIALKEATSQLPVESSETIQITLAHMMNVASRLFKNFWLSKKKREESDLVQFIGSKTFHMWADAVIAISPDQKELVEHAIIIFLTEEYGYTKLRNALENAEVMKKDPDLSSFLDHAQLRQWAEISLDVKKVFKLLKLGEKGDNILECPSRQKWVEFIGFRKQNENPYELLIKILKEQHGNQATPNADQMLANILRSAVKNEKVSRETYNQFEKALLKTWAVEGKSSDDVYSLMSIDKAKLPLESPFLATWIQYVWIQDLKLDTAQLLYAKLEVVHPMFDDLELAVTRAVKENHISNRLGERLLERAKKLSLKTSAVPDRNTKKRKFEA